jgi:predicted DCC family thiol-disulfide oxidoreductase YuxK
MNTVATPAGETRFTTERHPLTLFFDGQCVFCNRWVNRLREADHAHRLRFGAKQGRTFQELAQIHPDLAQVESVILVQRSADGFDHILVRSRAVREVIAGLPGFGLFALVLKIVPAPVADLGYRLFSKFRTRLFGRLSQCHRPSPEEKELYVD